MCRLLETIKIEDGYPRNLEHHNARMNYARFALFGRTDYIDLGRIITIPSDCRRGVFKCRVVYARDVITIGFERYEKRIIKSLKMVRDDHIDYSYKYENRERINRLMQQRDGCDDILIIKKDLVSDTSFSNIAFHDGHRWVTPSEPLLKGTKRELLLTKGIIEQECISVNDLHRFSRASLINAMLDLDDSVVETAGIVY
jgi:4-amino-4-deoxychorismate lyase